MPHSEGQDLAPDTVRLLHMMDAAKDALQFAVGRTRADLDSDRMFLRALVHCIQEVGEAAARVSEAQRAVAPEIPWTKIVGMRHRLVHVYYDINGLWRECSVAEAERCCRQMGWPRRRWIRRDPTSRGRPVWREQRRPQAG